MSDTQSQHPDGPGANIIALASGKGGVGKTLLSISLCHAFSKAGRRVLLFDGDLGLANVDVQLGLTPTRDLAAVIAGKVSMKHALTRFEDGQFDVLAGRSGTASLAALPSERLQGLRSGLLDIAPDYDRVLIDLGAGVDRTVRFMASTAATVLVVTTEEPTALTDAYAFIKLAQAAGTAGAIRLVINQATSQAEGERTYGTLLKACQNFLKLEPPLAGVVRRDSKVREAIRHQTSVLTRYPTSDAAADIEALARSLG